MDWRIGFVVCSLVLYADGFSKYGRSCRDIGCRPSEVCVLAEDTCSYGQTSNCGTYPTCKKSSQVEGSHSEPVQPSAPKPQTPNRDAPPHYPPPAPPGGSSFGGQSPYGNTGGQSPYGNTGGHSPYGNTGGNSPYGNTGGNSPYGSYGGNSPYGNTGGNSPYGNTGGNSPYGGSPYGSNGHGGSSSGGGSPYGSHSDRNPYGGSSSTGGKGGLSLDNILNTLNKYANSGGGGGGSSGGSNGFGNILGSILGPNSHQAPPVPTHTASQNRNYGQQSNAKRSSATTPSPLRYGWSMSVSILLTFLTHLYVNKLMEC